jgi:NADP-dependent 3-hydroxy-3-methylglutaryl-CoA reductase
MNTMKLQNILQQRTNGKVTFRAISRIPERGFHTEESRIRRCKFLQDKTGADLTSLTPHQLVTSDLKNNIESFIGAVELPVGVAGPLHLIGSDFEEMVFAPIATSEGALVASISRGAYAINLSGGVRVKFIKQRMNRVPVFHFKSMEDAHSFSTWCQSKFNQLNSVVKKYSCYAELQSLTPRIVGKSVNLKFSYQTGDAAGQNMTTTCTWHACQWLESQWKTETTLPLESFSIEGNGSCDKKVSFANFFEGRGCEAVAECIIPAEIFKRILKVTPEEFYEAFQRGVSQSCTLGMIGFNINVSNIIAGIFAATGQDIACVHESSLAHLNVELVDDKLYASIHLPSLVIGTVGGGTHLPVQRKLLELFGCEGAGKIQRFAESIAGFALALELSTGSAVAGGQFAMAHEKYGRNRPVNWLKQAELEEKILPEVLIDYLGGETTRNVEIKHNIEFQVGDSILSELCNNNLKKNIGLFPYDLKFNVNGRKQTLKTMVKLKALDTEMHQVGIKMAAMGSMELASLFKKFALKTGFTNCHKKELAICKQVHNNFTDHVPKTYYTKIDEKREIYLLVNKRLENTQLKDSADSLQGWQEIHIEEVIKSAASFHSIWFDKDHLTLENDYFVEKRLSPTDYYEMAPFFLSLLNNARNEFPEIVSQKHHTTISGIISQMDSWVPFYSKFPATLIHNDFNPRNITFQNGQPSPKAMIYDWELASIAMPQRDIAEFLCFVLKKDTELEKIIKYADMHRNELEFLVNRNLEREDWLKGFKLAIYDFIIGRLMMYMMAHTFKDYKFMGRVFDTSMSIVSKLEDKV